MARSRALALGRGATLLASLLATAQAGAADGPGELARQLSGTLDSQLREQVAAQRARAATLADLPRLQLAVATDATTVGDLTRDELAFRTQPGEVIEIGQVPREGATVSLWSSDPAAPSTTALLARPGVHLTIAGGTLRLVVVAEVTPRERGEELTGAIAISYAIDTSAASARLSAAGASANLEAGGATITLGGPPPTDAIDQPIKLASDKASELRIVLREPPAVAASSSATIFGAGAGALILVGIAAAIALSRGRRKQASSLPAPLIDAAMSPVAPPISTGASAAALAPPVARAGVALATAPTGFSSTSQVDAGAPTSGEAMLASSGGAAGIPPRIGRYTIVRALGEGGMASVYLARSSGEAGFEKLVALKVMQRHLAADARLVEHFLDEARLASHLAHPNIVPIIDLGRADDAYYIAMEFVDGSDLARLLERARDTRRPVPLRVGLAILRRVCDGLHAAHTATTAEGQPLEIVHRDVKSANVFVARNGAVKIGDFGIAKASEHARSYRTQAGEIKGTMAYMAPEHRVGQLVDARADVYSVGALAYEVLTNSLINLDFMRLAQQGIEGWPHLERPSLIRPELPAELDAIVFKALAYDRADRYADCATFEEAIERTALAHNLVGTDKQIAQWVESEIGGPARPGAPSGVIASPSRV